uniref:Probable phosphoenolpyruvate synthase n=1 Tax=uncultured marine group II/III euryarchaeote KM3_139_C07 TaxID=1457870 RepID=A0A075GB02_9EURY|nr:phosphoenolpyruvate synthase (pps, ppsA) [uncultured marine group II/III euryarchaeote KM3_139_C07]
MKIKHKKTKHYHHENILWLKDLKKSDIPIVGGKGANLGEVFDHFPVPNGFCITVNCYKHFMNETMIGSKIHGLLDELDVENTEQLELISKEIRKLILKQKFPSDIKKEILKNYKKLKNKKVAVRSSATAEDLPTASFAGQQDTYLNTKGNKDLIEAIQKCWASLFTSRAIYYREKNNFKHRDVLIAVVIQEMIDAKYAGVMFTIDPVNKKYILIEVVEGLGEALVSGQVTPNTYFMNKKTHYLEKKSENFKLDPTIITKISIIGEKIEKHYKYPQDIELALDKNNKIYILQSRPITTL